MNQVNLTGNYMYSLIGLVLWFDATSASLAFKGDVLGEEWELSGSVECKTIIDVDD